MIKRWLFAFSLLSLCLFSLPLTAVAGVFDPYSGVKCAASSGGETTKSAVCNDKTNQDPISGENGILLNAADIIAFVAGAAAIIIIIVAGIRYMTAGGDAAKISTAKNTIIGALVGIAVIVLGRYLIIYIVNRL